MNKITYLKEKNSSRKIEALLGNSTKSRIKGSTFYFIKSLKFKNSDDQIPHDAKGIFEVFDQGILLRVFKSTSNFYIPILFSTLNKIVLSKGREKVDLIYLSPMWILLKLGISLDIARYFGSKWREYYIEETTLKIISCNVEISLTTSGYAFKGQEKFFTQLDLNERLEINKTEPLWI